MYDIDKLPLMSWEKEEIEEFFNLRPWYKDMPKETLYEEMETFYELFQDKLEEANSLERKGDILHTYLKAIEEYEKKTIDKEKYKILTIQEVGTGKPRQDGRYPQRIGSIVSIYNPKSKIGECLILEYYKDNKGNPKDGLLRTSPIVAMELYDNLIIFYTMNSIYYLQKEEKEE